MPLAAAGSWLRGTNIPLININGNLIMVLSIWIGAGELVAGKEKINAIAEKQRALRIIPTANIMGCVK